MTTKVSYRISDKCRESHFLATGASLQSLVEVAVDPAAISEQARRGLRVSSAFQYSPSMRTNVRIEAGEIVGVYARRGNVVGDEIVTDHVLDDAEIVEALEAMGQYYDLIALVKEQNEALERVAQERLIARKAEERAAAQEKQAREAALKARSEAERAGWIDAHGSEFLRKAVAAGYDCQRCYVRERAALELGSCSIDFKDRAEWRDRSCPSEHALDQAVALKAAGFDARVVWLITDPRDFDDGYGETEPHEAVVVCGFLSKYTVILS